jgi:hypothetical protein
MLQFAMDISIITVVAILWAHFVGDFILQSDYHAVNKSKSNLALFEHVLYYSLPLTLVGFLIPVSIAWIAANAVMHAAVDYVTSRITSRLWVAGERHWFFVTIGADQSLHFTCLFVSYLWLTN